MFISRISLPTATSQVRPPVQFATPTCACTASCTVHWRTLPITEHFTASAAQTRSAGTNIRGTSSTTHCVVVLKYRSYMCSWLVLRSQQFDPSYTSAPSSTSYSNSVGPVQSATSSGTETPLEGVWCEGEDDWDMDK